MIGGEGVTASGRKGLAHLTVGLLPSLLLISVAVRQIWLAQTDLLSPWKGGGFGMFATVDSPGNRVVHARGWRDTDAGGREVVYIRLGSELPVGAGARADLLRKLQTFPTQADLDVLADALLRIDYVEIDSSDQARQEAFLSSNPELVAKLPGLPLRRVVEAVPLDPRRPGHERERSFRIAEVEVSLWRGRFDPASLTVGLERLLGAEGDDG